MERDLAAFARRLRSEAAEAAVLCERVLAGPSTWWAERFRASSRGRTTGTVQRLIECMRATINRSPEDAELMASIAVELAFAIEDGVYPPIHLDMVQGQALRNHAYILSYRGRRREAMELAERAASLFAKYPAAAYEGARLKIVKASILQSSERVDEAITLTREAAATFLRFEDHRRHLDARIWEGILLYNAGAVDQAYAVWKPLENDAAMDRVSSAQLAHNLGLCLSDLGQHDAATPHLQRSASEFAALKMDTDSTRSRAVLGRLLVATGQVREGLSILEGVVQEFDAHGMIMDAGLARLDVVEALLLANDPAEVPAICRLAIANFTRAGAAAHATTALTYLREAATLPPAAPTFVRKARTAMRKLAAEHPALFANA